MKCLKNASPIGIKGNRAGSLLSWFFTAANNTGYQSIKTEENNPVTLGSQMHRISYVLSLCLFAMLLPERNYPPAPDGSFGKPGMPFGLTSSHYRCNRHQSGNTKLFPVKLHCSSATGPACTVRALKPPWIRTRPEPKVICTTCGFINQISPGRHI